MAEVKFQFDGGEYVADSSITESYAKMKKIAAAADKDVSSRNPSIVFDVFSLIFGGRDDEYAERLGDSMEKMGELMAAAMEAINAKNS